MTKLNRFAKFAWGVVVYNLGVVLWGAYVRATGSGAGCGRHWPLCNGEVTPRAPRMETIIEYTHRVSSGLALLLVVALLVWALRKYTKGSPVRLGAVLSMVFMLTEAAVGAGLVLFELVADNDSMARAWIMAVHLVNTFLLMASLTLTAWWASGGRPVRLRGQGALGGLLLAGIGGMLILGVSGAITALGDTLFPAGSLAEGLRQDFSPTAHVLVRLRVWHPVLALSLGAYLTLVAAYATVAREDLATKRLARLLITFFVIQIGAGVLNIALLAPVWLQLVHLALADTVWLTLVLLTASVFAVPAEPGVPAAVTA